MRMFVAPNQAVRAFNLGTVSSVHIIDGGHSKTKRYDGYHLVLIGKDGNGRNCPQAYGWVPAEAVVSNLCWFMQMVEKTGFPFNHIPIFTDRGHLLNTVIVLQSAGIFLNLKYCLKYIFKNICHNFKLAGRQHQSTRSIVRCGLGSIQGSQSCSRWIRNVQDFMKALPDELSVAIALYVLSIDPIHYAVFANVPKFN
jgi:hypothetical protein